MEVQCNPAVITEVSLSFRDELTSTLQNALGVAVDIAVVEISKLLDRALRDVQEKIQEALRDNHALKYRLQTAEIQLSTVRARLDQQPQGLEDFPNGNTSQPAIYLPRAERGHRQFKTLHVVRSSPITLHETELSLDSEHNYEVCGSKETSLLKKESDCAVTHGGLGAQTLNSNTREESTQHRLDETTDKNEVYPKMLDPNMSKDFQACPGTSTGELSDGSSFEVSVKMEKDEGYGDPIPVSVPGEEEEPNSDSLSLAQSQLLQDWRPQPLYLEDCQSNQPCQSTGLPLDQDFLSSSTSSQHDHFPKLHRNPESHQYPSDRSLYHCSLCGRGFNRKHHLKIHQRIHTGERPYACSVCSARFRHALTLTRHFRIHTGEKPYACGQCGKTFRNGGGLKFHQCSITTTV
ncbi:zinc finger protein 776 [Triplophysa rosa]|uniref:zinc finger protein 776 n=1 Tax=Triplophysa rosa TaxID=992332 RepID=UPI002545F79C|nr:zinc finger protein 776 [Triplophysa rosa]